MNNTIITSVKHYFTETEKVELGSKIAQKYNSFDALQTEKKTAMSSYKAQLEEIDKEIKELVLHIVKGYHFVDMECILETDYLTNEKIFRNPETMEIVKREPLNKKENQDSIFEKNGATNEDEDEDELYGEENIENKEFE